MSKKKRFILISVAIILAVILIGLIFLIGIRTEFKTHLNEKYPLLDFTVGFTKIDIIYGNFYAYVICSDGVSFGVSKGFNTRTIRDGYLEQKSKMQYNSKIQEIIEDSTLRDEIISVTGGGKELFENGDFYEGMYIHISNNADVIMTAEVILKTLKENNITVERIVITQEIENHVYETVLSSHDYGITSKEIELRIQKIK